MPRNVIVQRPRKRSISAITDVCRFANAERDQPHKHALRVGEYLGRSLASGTQLASPLPAVALTLQNLPMTLRRYPVASNVLLPSFQLRSVQGCTLAEVLLEIPMHRKECRSLPYSQKEHPPASGQSSPACTLLWRWCAVTAT